MNKNEFYSYINKKFLIDIIEKNKIINQKNLILYDYEINYIDIKNNKIRLGITDFKDESIKQKIKQISNISKFDIIDIRTILQYNFDIQDILKFISNMIGQAGYIIGFVNVLTTINDSNIDNISDTNVVSRFTKIENKNTLLDMKHFEKILKQHNMILENSIPLNFIKDNFDVKLDSDYDFNGELFIIIKNNIST